MPVAGAPTSPGAALTVPPSPAPTVPAAPGWLLTATGWTPAPAGAPPTGAARLWLLPGVPAGHGCPAGWARTLSPEEWARSRRQARLDDQQFSLICAGFRRAVLGQVHSQLPVEDVLTHVISPTLADIGARWERGEITVAHEHQASAFLRARLSHLMDVAGVQEGFGPLVVAACAPGEEHELGLMMLTLALRRRGVRVAYLGANVPLGDLAVFTRQQGAQIGRAHV